MELNVPELHDRMICAVALAHNEGVITNDREIREGVHTIGKAIEDKRVEILRSHLDVDSFIKYLTCPLRYGSWFDPSQTLDFIICLIYRYHIMIIRKAVAACTESKKVKA